MCDWFDAQVGIALFDASTEVGPKAGHLHIQAILEAFMLADEETLKRFKTDLKAVLNCRWGDKSGVAIHIKELVAGQTVVRMIGYVHKDRLLSTFRNRNKNVTEDMIKRGIEEHVTLKISFTDNKIVINKSNLFQKVYVKWVNEIAPKKMLFSAILCEILNDGMHVLSAHVLMNGAGQMRRSTAEIYWALLMGKEVTEYEVRHMLYHPKNAFAGHEYIPHDLPTKHPVSDRE